MVAKRCCHKALRRTVRLQNLRAKAPQQPNVSSFIGCRSVQLSNTAATAVEPRYYQALHTNSAAAEFCCCRTLAESNTSYRTLRFWNSAGGCRTMLRSRTTLQQSNSAAAAAAERAVKHCSRLSLLSTKHVTAKILQLQNYACLLTLLLLNEKLSRSSAIPGTTTTTAAVELCCNEAHLLIACETLLLSNNRLRNTAAVEGAHPAAVELLIPGTVPRPSRWRYHNFCNTTNWNFVFGSSDADESHLSLRSHKSLEKLTHWNTFCSNCQKSDCGLSFCLDCTSFVVSMTKMRRRFSNFRFA